MSKRTCPACYGSGLHPFRPSDCDTCGGAKVVTSTKPTTADLVRVRKIMSFGDVTLYQAGTPKGFCHIHVGKNGISCREHPVGICEGRTRLSCSGLLKDDPNHAPAESHDGVLRSAIGHSGNPPTTPEAA